MYRVRKFTTGIWGLLSLLGLLQSDYYFMTPLSQLRLDQKFLKLKHSFRNSSGYKISFFVGFDEIVSKEIS